MTTTRLLKFYENKDSVKSKHFFLHKTGILNNKQLTSSIIKSIKLLQVFFTLNIF